MLEKGVVEKGGVTRILTKIPGGNGRYVKLDKTSPETIENCDSPHHAQPIAFPRTCESFPGNDSANFISEHPLPRPVCERSGAAVAFSTG